MFPGIFWVAPSNHCSWAGLWYLALLLLPGIPSRHGFHFFLFSVFFPWPVLPLPSSLPWLVKRGSIFANMITSIQSSPIPRVLIFRSWIQFWGEARPQCSWLFGWFGQRGTALHEGELKQAWKSVQRCAEKNWSSTNSVKRVPHHLNCQPTNHMQGD